LRLKEDRTNFIFINSRHREGKLVSITRKIKKYIYTITRSTFNLRQVINICISEHGFARGLLGPRDE